jgi:protein-L-isoaspartate(D-aspartate) O-methyltransferase
MNLLFLVSVMNTKTTNIIKFLSIIFYLFLFINCQANSNEKNHHHKNKKNDRYEQMRNNMVEKQIKARGVKSGRLLKAMKKIPRHLFVPENVKDLAYIDEPLPIGSGQTISQPYIVAYMTEQLSLKGKEKVLEIGTGSGYQAAVLAELCDSVFTIEIIPELSKNAQKVLEKLKYKNIHYKIGNGYYGWPEKAPFDGIIVTAAPQKIPEILIDQLKVGGRMIIPVGNFFQELYLIIKTKDSYKKQTKLPVRFVPLIEEPRK